MAELMKRIKSDGRTDRGQLILVTGFVLAITLVALVLLLNTTIYTENIASRGLDRSPQEAIEYREAVRDGVGDLLEEANDHDTPDQNFLDGLGNLSEILPDVYADRGTVAILNDSSTTTTDGIRIWQANSSNSFANVSEDGVPSNWTVATDVDAARAVRLNVSESGLVDGGVNPESSDTFRIKLNDTGGGNWTAFIYTKGGDVFVQTQLNGNEQAECSTNDSTVEIDLTEGKLGGEHCTNLEWAKGFNTTYDIEFVNPDNVKGTYNITLQGDVTNIDTTNNFNSTSEPAGPYQKEVIYSATIPIYYQTSTITYETNVTVAPGASRS